MLTLERSAVVHWVTLAPLAGMDLRQETMFHQVTENMDISTRKCRFTTHPHIFWQLSKMERKKEKIMAQYIHALNSPQIWEKRKEEEKKKFSTVHIKTYQQHVQYHHPQRHFHAPQGIDRPPYITQNYSQKISLSQHRWIEARVKQSRETSFTVTQSVQISSHTHIHVRGTARSDCSFSNKIKLK